jgi:hypothetical protein
MPRNKKADVMIRGSAVPKRIAVMLPFGIKRLSNTLLPADAASHVKANW